VIKRKPKEKKVKMGRQHTTEESCVYEERRQGRCSPPLPTFGSNDTRKQRETRQGTKGVCANDRICRSAFSARYRESGREKAFLFLERERRRGLREALRVLLPLLGFVVSSEGAAALRDTFRGAAVDDSFGITTTG
jgi:hypothetical protein